MGYKYSFMDNETYGADDINAAISRLTTKGVTVYPTDQNLIDAMNGVISAVATPGVDYNQYSCVVSIENNNIKISPGTVFFENGISMVIDSDGEILPLEYNIYVYLYYDKIRNSCYPCASENIPENNYVLLAYIDETGNIKDMREYATSKLAPNSEIKISTFITDLKYSTDTSPEEVLATINVGYTSYRHVVFSHKSEKLTGYAMLVDDDYSEYVDFCDGSDIRFKKIGPTLQLSVHPHGDFETLTNLKIIVF